MLRYLLLLLIGGFHLSLSSQNTLESGLERLSLLGCGLSGAEINITGTGNIQSHKAYFNKETTLDEINVNFNVRVDSLNSSGEFRFGIGKYSTTSGVTLAGTMVELGGTASNTNVYINKLNGTTATLVLQFPLPFTLVTGVDYKITVGKKVRGLILEISSDSTSDYFLYDSLSYPTPFFGCMWGTPFIGCKQGSISVTEFSLTTNLSTAPRLSVWGDSFIEGNALDSVEDRYVSLIKDSIGYQNVSIMGRGGETSGTMNNRFSKEHQWFKDSKYALIAIGVNDNTFSTWKTNTLRYIDSLKKDGIIPLIATLSPRSDRLSYIAQVNNWIRNDYNGAYIDVSKAVSPSGTTWLPGLGVTDSIHPSVAGHAAIYNRIQLEAPYLFEESDKFSINFMLEKTNESISDTLEYSSMSNFTSSTTGNISTINVVPGETLFFRDTAQLAGVNSLYSILAVPSRPAAPTGPHINYGWGEFDWTYNLLYTNHDMYEFSVDSGATWTTCTEKPIVSPGTRELDLRIKAGRNHFKGSVLHFHVDPRIASSLALSLAYPNPFNERLIIEGLSEKATFEIYSVDGKKIEEGLLGSGFNEINTSALSSGFYIFVINNGTESKNFKLLKE